MPRKTKKQLLAERAEQAKAAAQKRTTEYEFYSQARWDNWIGQIREIDPARDAGGNEEDDPVAAVIVNMEDDVILACLKIVARFDKEAVSREKALEIFNKIRDIVLAPVEEISDYADFMICSVQDSLSCSLAAFEVYFNHDYEENMDFRELIEEAFEAEEDGDLDLAFGIIAVAGAGVIAGQVIDEDILAGIPEERQDTAVAVWLDGIDSIVAAMVGSDSYKNFDEDDDGSD
ncbi:DUF2150 family protein [Methanosarcinaceae archaeon]|nr:DUF2150 family protein [Methanosarcinaceae archaeon]